MADVWIKTKLFLGDMLVSHHTIAIAGMWHIISTYKFQGKHFCELFCFCYGVNFTFQFLTFRLDTNKIAVESYYIIGSFPMPQSGFG